MSNENIEAIDAALQRALEDRRRLVLLTGGRQGQPEDAKAFIAAQDTIEALLAARDDEVQRL